MATLLSSFVVLRSSSPWSFWSGANRCCGRRQGGHARILRSAGGDLAVGGVALLGASIPCLASGRVGPGAGVDNDMAIHLLVAEALRSPRIGGDLERPDRQGYPTGPHSVVATVGTAADLPLIMVFTGLLLAVVVLTAVAAGDFLAAERLWRRVAIGGLCSLTYLVAAFYGEGAFKETIMAGLLLGFVLHLEQMRSRWAGAHGGRAVRARPSSRPIWWLEAIYKLTAIQVSSGSWER